LQSKENFILDKYLNKEITTLFKDILKIIIKQPSLTKFFLKTFRWQKKAGNLRLQWEKNGIHVPPFMIFSITNRCNLSCKGCYAEAFRKKDADDISADKFRSIIHEAHELGTSIILIAGGEPLLRKDLLKVTSDYPDIIFTVFTNGLLLDEEIITKLETVSNFIPVISIEGLQTETDNRRGKGVYDYICKIIEIIKGRSIFWGVSLTLTCENFNVITSHDFIENLIKLGCKLFFYVSYIPVKSGTENLCITSSQEKKIGKLTLDYRKKYPALFIAFPGGEEELGGCLASGRGFVHISPEGNLEPCPFAPYSDTNLKNLSLKEALSSDFLRKIRENHDKLSETKGGCALWENREWVQSILK
jgi:MoaA/NifB/PqqE/SkfB family radical SAM enzyme